MNRLEVLAESFSQASGTLSHSGDSAALLTNPSFDLQDTEFDSSHSLSDFVATLAEPAPRDTTRRPPEMASFLPMHYEPGYAYPLVVWLHDHGQSERSLPQLMPHVSTRNYLAVAPRGTSECEGAWQWSQTPGGIEEAEARVEATVQFAKSKFNIHADRIFLVGEGSGGSMALRLGLLHPEWFAGVASLSGSLPRTQQPLRRINDIQDFEVLLSSGKESTRYPEALLSQDLRLLHHSGCKINVQFCSDDGELTTDLLSNLDRWMMNLVCGS